MYVVNVYTKCTWTLYLKSVCSNVLAVLVYALTQVCYVRNVSSDAIASSVQVTLPQEVGPRHDHTATVFGSGPHFRMVVMFGGEGKFVEKAIADTTLLHLGECVVWNIGCYMSRNIPSGKVPTSGAAAAT